jgi:ABC-type uncharacterized transport system permease subunit
MHTVVLTLTSVAFAILASSLILLSLGTDPLLVFETIFLESFGDFYGFSETVVKATPILFCGLAVAIPAWVGLMNIGAEGQLHVGAAAAAGIALFLPNLSAWILIPTMLGAAMVAGGLWGGIAGILKARLGVNEVMVTLMGNFIAVLYVDHLVHGPWKDPASYGWPQTASFTTAAILPHLGTSRVHLGLFIGLVAAVLLYAVKRWTTLGLGMRIIHSSPETAFYAGINYRRYFIWTMIVGGSLAALAGAVEISAIQGRLRSSISTDYGYTGILVSWMAGHHPLSVIIIALFVGGLLAGGDNLQIEMGLPFATVNIVLGLMFFFLLVGSYFFSRKLRQGVSGES